jgi:hypothetical protein
LFFGIRAQRGGWTVVTRNVLGLAVGWRKVFRGGQSASLALYGFDPRDLAPRPRSYRLSGSIVAGSPGRPRSGRNGS